MTASHTSASSAHPAPVNDWGVGPEQRFAKLLGSLNLSEDTVAQLRAFLAGTLAEMNSLTEQNQASREDLAGANEVFQSVNEEMLSTNEELEASTEELRCVNDELRALNRTLTQKIHELDIVNSDLRNLFASTDIATLFLNRDLVIRNFTPASARLYRLIGSDEGRPLTDIASRFRCETLTDDVGAVLSSLTPLERRIVTDDAATFIMRILPYRELDQRISGVLVTFVDITNIVQAEERLVEADYRKDVFLATLSHELRNPLAPIRVVAELLHSPELLRDQLERAHDIISRQVAHMSALLDDLLDVSSITRDVLVLKKRTVNVQGIIEDAVEAARPRIVDKCHTLNVEFPASPIWLEADPVRITQVITNILTNAAKYTPAGGVISLSTQLGNDHFCVAVGDSGIGLTGEHMGKVFGMFTRIDTATARAEGGLGIGLALAKGLMKLHGGELLVRSGGLGEGSEFTLRLPSSAVVEAPSVALPCSSTAIRIAPRRILIADDNLDAADSLSMLLKLAGHEVHLAHSGAQALEMAAYLKPEIGIFDIGMPDLTGYEVAQRIRHEAWAKQVKLIAVTGWGQEEDKRCALAAGFDHHLTKPISSDELEQLLRL
jgi:two-component system, chemotaxis family, CheB/CheR fusion protein